MKTHNYKIEGLDCAMCADSIQRKLATLAWVDSAAVNFNLAKASISTSREDDIFEEVKEIIKKVESGAKVSRMDEENLASRRSSRWYNDWFAWCFVLGAIIGTIGVLLDHFTAYSIAALVSLCAGGALMLIRTAKRAVLKIVHAHAIDENFLVAISVIGAIAIGEGMEGIMVIFLYQIGKFLEASAVTKTRKDLDSLLKVKPSTVRLKTERGIVEVAPSTVAVGSTILVYAGDIVALDGEVISGSASLNMSSLTGESAPVTIETGEQILSGSVNLDGVLTIRTTSTDSDSTITKIMNLVETAAERKAKTETIVSKAARYYTPIVIFLALFVGLMFGLVGKIGVKESIYRGMIFLVISCPCAIAISVPLSYFSGIGNASKKGILVKGSNYLDAVASLQAVVFDKTGTITTGEFTVNDIEVIGADYNKAAILRIAAVGEVNSTHPIAKAIVARYNDDLSQGIYSGDDKLKAPQNVNEVAGRGLSYKLDGKEVFVGRGTSESNHTAVEVLIDGTTIGKILLSDQIKSGAKDTVKYLHDRGIATYMFTGDNSAVAKSVASEIGIDNVYAEMLPDDKYSKLEEVLTMNKGNGVCAFVGDGINDAPVLTRADVGIAMGLSGSKATIDTADVVLMNDDIGKLPVLHKLSRFTKLIVKQNLIFSIAIKLLFMILGTIGITGMAWAVVADTGLTLCTIFNSIRVLKLK